MRAECSAQLAGRLHSMAFSAARFRVRPAGYRESFMNVDHQPGRKQQCRNPKVTALVRIGLRGMLWMKATAAKVPLPVLVSLLVAAQETVLIGLPINIAAAVD